MKEPGLDGRHRDKDGEIERKRKDTRVRTLRDTYGTSFLRGLRGNATLGTAMKKRRARSLKKLIRKTR